MQLKHCFVKVMEEKNKIDKAIEQAIRRVGQERDAEDIATLQRFMNSQITNELFINEEYYILESSLALGDYYYNIPENSKEALKEYFRALQVVENSCNPGFVNLGLKLGKEKLFSYIDKFGFGKKTGVDLNGESNGILFKLDKIGDLELATTAFGSIFLSTTTNFLHTGHTTP